jgi:hypothetical protein
VQRTWGRDSIQVVLPKRLSTFPIPDEPGTVAFMDGPVVLAGLCAEAELLIGDVDDVHTLLTPDNEREWSRWLAGYRTYTQARTIRFRPLYDVRDQRYTVYFPVRRAP